MPTVVTVSLQTMTFSYLFPDWLVSPGWASVRTMTVVISTCTESIGTGFNVLNNDVDRDDDARTFNDFITITLVVVTIWLCVECGV